MHKKNKIITWILARKTFFCVFIPHRAQNPGHDAHPQWSPQPESLHAPFSCRSSAGYHTHSSHSHHKHKPVAACKCSFNGHLQHWAEVTGEPSALVKWSVIKLIYSQWHRGSNLCCALNSHDNSRCMVFHVMLLMIGVPDRLIRMFSRGICAGCATYVFFKVKFVDAWI